MSPGVYECEFGVRPGWMGGKAACEFGASPVVSERPESSPLAVHESQEGQKCESVVVQEYHGGQKCESVCSPRVSWRPKM